jgi:HEAT repeat protein
MLFRAPLIATCAAVGIAICAAAAEAGPIDPDVDSAMAQDPLVPLVPPVPVFSEGLKPLWLEALARPEADLKRLVATTIARAHRAGMPGLDEAIAPLTAALDEPDQHHVVRLAVAQTLVALDARGSADMLRKHAGGSLAIAQVVEPALAAWNDPPAREMWLARLNQADVRPQRFVLAIDALGEVREPRAADRLLAMALDGTNRPDVRLSAARAVARIRDSGLEESARALNAHSSRAGIIDRLVAASLLSGHRGETAQALLAQFAVDEEPAVAATALRRLLEIDPALVLPLAPGAIRRNDPHVRRLGAESLIALPTGERIAVLGTMLDDVHPDVRRFVRRELVKLAEQPPLTEAVIQAAVSQLEQESWRGQEQAMFILVARDHQPAIPRLVELLESTREEVLVTSAWALRRLEARDVLPQMLDRAARVTDMFVPPTGEIPTVETTKALPGMHLQLGQFFEAFGQMDYRAAEPLMRRFVGKNFMYTEYGRSRAIWALGHFHAGQPEPSLVSQFIERLDDVASIPPEMYEVRMACAISLGRMHAESALPTLRKYANNLEPAGYICLWAVHQFTGEPLPAMKPARVGFTSFLVPLD